MDILKVYKARCREEFYQYGFKSHGNNHFRIINDVYQDFLLFRSMSGYECKIQFTIFPLCYGLDKRYKCGGYLGFESGGPYREWGWMFNTGERKESRGWMFEYDRNSEKSIKNCVEEMISYIKTKIIPFLERGSDSASAYKEIRSLKDSILGGREGNEYIYDDDDRMYCMLLKMGDYDKAVEYLKREIDEYKNLIEEYENLNEDRDETYISPEEKNQEFKEKIVNLEEEMRHVSQRDMDYINKFIKTNERKSLESLLTPKELEKWKKENGKD